MVKINKFSRASSTEIEVKSVTWQSGDMTVDCEEYFYNCWLLLFVTTIAAARMSIRCSFSTIYIFQPHDCSSSTWMIKDRVSQVYLVTKLLRIWAQVRAHTIHFMQHSQVIDNVITWQCSSACQSGRGSSYYFLKLYFIIFFYKFAVDTTALWHKLIQSTKMWYPLTILFKISIACNVEPGLQRDSGAIVFLC